MSYPAGKPEISTTQVENSFTHTKMTTIWIVATFVIGLIVSWQFESGYEKTGAIGLGSAFLGIIIGCFRTGSFFTWDEPVEPTQFEGVLGWSGAALLVAAIIGYTLRVAFGKF